MWLDSLNQTNGYKLQDGGDITHPYLLQYGKFAYLEGKIDVPVDYLNQYYNNDGLQVDDGIIFDVFS